jgi:dipeptidyl-peptidase-4
MPRFACRLVCFALCCAFSLLAQQPTAITTQDYARAEKFLSYNTRNLVFHTVKPAWIDEHRFWYRDRSSPGVQFLIYDAGQQKAAPAFDHAKIAAALSRATGRNYDPNHLPFMEIDFTPDGQAISFIHMRQVWRCDLAGNSCEKTGERLDCSGRTCLRLEALSPDGKLAAFIRDWNLWVRDVASRKETQLTKDGQKDYGYATDNAGWIHSDRPILLWSPDSRKIATFQQDQRRTEDMYEVETILGHPKLYAWKYPLVGDENITMIERVVIDVSAAKVIRLKMPPDQHRSSLCDHVACEGNTFSDVDWSPDSKTLAFVSTSRDHKREQLRIADAETGAVREVLQESVATYYESGLGAIDWRYLPKSNEILWYSNRDNWGQLYLYDPQSGKLKNQITSGEGNVTRVEYVDEQNRVIYFLAVGRERGRDPYFSLLYRVGFDGKGLTLLTPEPGTHDIYFPASPKYFVDSYSSPETPHVTVLRALDGHVLATIAKEDITRLRAAGWQPPIPITVKGRDGQTDLYGLMYRPTNFDSTKKYPIVNHIYPGPQTGSVGTRGFVASRGDCQALAELGFVVVEIDGMGTPWRGKKFQDTWFGDMGDNTLPDQVTGMKQLAAKYPWIDLDRAGIYGHSGGGNATADAMFRYPDFFKVGIAEAGNHDNREYEDDWGEKYQGLLVKNADGSTNYDNQANQLLAKNLKGHLLLAHGTLDDNVPPYSTLLVVDALIKANKDFDLLLLPNRHHGFGNEPYMVRRRWDYFVRYLMGAEPPHEYELKQPRAGDEEQ